MSRPTTRHSAETRPPGPRGHFLVGNLPELARDWVGFLTKCAREYGDVVFFRFLGTPICLLVHPKDIERVLVKDHAHFVKSKDYRALRGLLGNGLLTSEGEAWRFQRTLAHQALRHERMAAYAQVMVKAAEQMVVDWRDGETRDLHKELMGLALQVVGQALFGADLSASAAEVGAALRVVVERLLLRADLAFVLPDGWPIPSGPRFQRAVRRLDDVARAIITERRRARERRTDLLDVLLEAGGETAGVMDDRRIRDEIMTFLLAGHETTAIALSWGWYLLAQHPCVEARLVGELDQALGGRAPTLDDLPHLRYTDMVVKEAMRLYPPAWGIGRRGLRDFEAGGYRLPAGTNVLLSQWITQRDPRFYREPERFNPDRWADDPVGRGLLPRFAYFPFGGGPRVCIGASFAMAEAILVLATIAQRFHLALIPGQRVEPQASLTLRPREGIKVILHAR